MGFDELYLKNRIDGIGINMKYWRMWVVSTIVVLGVSIAAPLSASAQNFFGKEIKIPDVLATFETKIEPANARPGEHVRLVVTAKITDGWYTYSVVPQGDMAPPPTSFQVDAANLIPQGPFYETNPINARDKVFNLPLAYHKKAARFYQNYKLPDDIAAGEMAIRGQVKFQVCNNEICTPPKKQKLRTALTVVEGEARPAYAYAQRTIDYLTPDGKFQISADTLEGALEGGLWTFVLLAAGFGLLALLTPCVFPMIPITVAFFTSESKRSSKGAFRLALLFGVGIIVTYTGLGLLLTFLLGAAGVSQFAVNPWVNIAVAVFFGLFAFSLMGVLEFALPGGLVQRVDASSRNIKGPAGVLLMGVAFTATSFTCTMPFVGTLLIAATQGEVLWPLVGMLVFSTVFALPFFLLALFPRYLVNLRGSGGSWLIQLKVALGLVELMAALKFVSNADLIWQWGVFTREVVLVLWGGLALVTAVMLLGLIPWPGVKVERLRVGRAGGAVLFLVLSVYLFLGVTGRELDAYTEAYLPPPLESNALATRASGEYMDDEAVKKLGWETSLDEGLKRAQIEGKPVFIDFTGYTCVNCRWMERNVFAEKSVFETLRDKFVLVQLYTDGGDNAERNQQIQIERFRTMALPYYVILSPSNEPVAKHAGITATPGEFLTWLQRGLGRVEEINLSNQNTPSQ